MAYATVLSQAISALLCLLLLLRAKESYGFRFLEGGLSWDVVMQVFKIGMPIGIQKALTQFSNVIVLSYINFFGEACLASWVVYTKVSQFIVVGLQSIGSSVTTFVSQNMGARQYDRTRQGVKVAVMMSAIFTFLCSVSTFVLRYPIARLFGDDAPMLYYAEFFISHFILLQLFHTPQSVYSAALRGMGHAAAATYLMLLGLIGARQLYLVLITQLINTPAAVGLAFPLGWMSSGLMLLLYYYFYPRH